jgi:hypothetical protein
MIHGQQLGLHRPPHAQLCSRARLEAADHAGAFAAEQWHGRVVRKDYEAQLRRLYDKPEAPTALSRLAIMFEHYNERNPYKALKYRSPR